MRRAILTVGIAIIIGAVWFREKLIGYLPAKGLDFSMNRNDVRVALRVAAVRGGYDPDWFDAIACVESDWNLGATNLEGADGKRGGAWGPMQMTSATAVALGYDPMLFIVDVDYAGEAAAKNFDDVNPQTFEDACSYWNAGVPKFADLSPNHVTRTTYVPRALKALAMVRLNPPTI